MTGEKLKELRTQKGLSRPQLAKMIRYNPMTIYKWENGIIPKKGVHLLPRVKRLLISVLGSLPNKNA